MIDKFVCQPTNEEILLELVFGVEFIQSDDDVCIYGNRN